MKSGRHRADLPYCRCDTFNLLNIDIAGTVETTSINDQTRPRGLIANIGFNVLF